MNDNCLNKIELKDFCDLVVLHAEKNKIVNVDLQNFPNLARIFLKQNRIKSLDWLDDFSNLTHLDLTNNEVSHSEIKSKLNSLRNKKKNNSLNRKNKNP
jgi:hypothetical protein